MILRGNHLVFLQQNWRQPRSKLKQIRKQLMIGHENVTSFKRFVCSKKKKKLKKKKHKGKLLQTLQDAEYFI